MQEFISAAESYFPSHIMHFCTRISSKLFLQNFVKSYREALSIKLQYDFSFFSSPSMTFFTKSFLEDLNQIHFLQLFYWRALFYDIQGTETFNCTTMLCYKWPPSTEFIYGWQQTQFKHAFVKERPVSNVVINEKT